MSVCPLCPEFKGFQDRVLGRYFGISPAYLELAYNETALRKLGRAKYDLILGDFKMPGLSGPEFYERLASIDPAAAARVIFMTGDVAGENTQKFLRNHGKICISKPFSIDEFRSTVGQAIKTA